ncbi:uncharacterized protein FTOL_11854 [Fusarium torulosum]|uniref:Uncharacterized protein n=1 Tax=Fusarium torulosum TaxID=33205 RepID=A0AAE8MKP7_9HYPO|nr:uncharacterized protein FTOL_11854 [Fusarium torulosum]
MASFGAMAKRKVDQVPVPNDADRDATRAVQASDEMGLSPASTTTTTTTIMG